jgi:hypothetical protein
MLVDEGRDAHAFLAQHEFVHEAFPQRFVETVGERLTLIGVCDDRHVRCH